MISGYVNNAMNFLLVYPPYSYPKKAPPIGLGYIAAVLEQEGHVVKILDMSVMGIDNSDLINEIKDTKPGVVGISFMTNQYNNAISIAEAAKAASDATTVIAGGPHASALPLEVANEKSVDIVVIGEGERTIIEVINKLENKESLEGVKGIAFKNGDIIAINERRELIEDLDSLPFPAWHLLPLDCYTIPSTGGSSTKQVFALLSSRGCPNNCIFCDSHTVFGRRFRWRSANNIISEIKYLSEDFGAKQFDFVDDTLTVNRKRAMEICSQFIANKLNITWMCNARVNTVNMEMLEEMKKAGCARIEFGVESCDQSVLNIMKKGITLKQIENAHRMAKEAGLSIGTFIMVGNLGEDSNSIKRTEECLKKLDTDDIYISIATPFPGTELYNIAKRNGWLRTENWSEYVTAPTYYEDYEPLMETDKMAPQQIIDNFFYLHSRFVVKKFSTRYGKRFLLNPRFYREVLLSVHNKEELLYRIRLAKRMLVTYLRR